MDTTRAVTCIEHYNQIHANREFQQKHGLKYILQHRFCDIIQKLFKTLVHKVLRHGSAVTETP